MRNLMLLSGIGAMMYFGWFIIVTSGTEPSISRSYKTVTCATVPQASFDDWEYSEIEAPLFSGLGDHEFPVTTNNQLVQRYFNQGLTLAYGFNHAEAARSFYYASELDRECAMAYWGYAYVLGPNYNAAMDAENYPKAYYAIQKAISLTDKCTPKEAALIQALSKRYVKEPVDDRLSLDEDYAHAMQKVFGEFPNDPDVGTLYAESLMNLHPWDLWETNGNPKPWTPEILTTLEKVIKLNPKHHGAHHFYIHAVEASGEPEKGYGSAQLYDEGLVPAAGHLVHMPSHIYIRTGDYHKGTLSNIQAVKADSLYTTACHAQGMYPLAYYPHNYHFLAATATLEGNKKWGVEAAQKINQQVDKQRMKEPGWGTLQHYYSIPYYVYVKFGMWKEILQLQNEEPGLEYPAAILAYARGMAHLGLNDLQSAKIELTKLEKYAADTKFKEITIWDINTTYDLINIAADVLKAEILASENNFEESIALLRQAIKIEDNLNYNEPPDWFFSVRHNLGSIQIEAKKYNDAIQTFQEDLKTFPKNGWALHGLKKAYAN